MQHEAAFLLQQLLNATLLAAFYIPLSVAFSLIQSITRRVFLSFGDLAMFGSFAAVYICFGRLLQGDADTTAALWALIAAIICAAALGFALAHLAFVKLAMSAPQAFMIASLGFSIFLQELMRISSGSHDIWVPPLFDGIKLQLASGSFPVNISANAAFAIAASITAVVLVALLLRFTHMGRSIQAISQNPRLAALCGVNTDRVIALTFALGAGLSAVSGWMSAITYGGTNSAAGVMLGFKAMFAAVAGGFASLRGAVAGAIALAILEVAWSSTFGSTYRDVGVFAIVIVILLFRPEGLGSSAERERD